MKNVYMRRVSILAFIICFLSFTSQATDYYIDSQLGNDNNNGTSSSTPWKTLAKVSAFTFSPGDVIRFKANRVWNERVQFKGSGAAGNPIEVTKYGGSNKPIFNGGGGGVNDEPTVLIQNEEYWEIRNLEITNTDGTLDQYQGDLWGIWVDVTQAGEYNHIYISDCYIHAVGSDVPEESKGGKDAGGISVTVNTGLSNPAWYNDVQIVNNVIGGEKGGDLVGGVGISTQSPQGKLSHGTSRNPFLNVRITDNVVGPTGRNNIIIRVSDGAVVEHNTLKESSRFSTGHNVFNFNCINTTIQFNEAYGNTGKASDIDRGGYDADFEIRDTYFQYNYSHDNNWGFAWMKKGENDNAVFRYNISQDDRMHIYHYGFTGEPGPQNAQAYNNTHYVSAHLDVQVFSHRVANNTAFRNNIFYFEGQGEWGVTEPDASCVFENNAYFNLAPRGSNYIISDPKLVDMGSGGEDINWSNYPNILTGYKLQGNSPCINAGTTIANNGGKDFWGNSLYNGNPDIGAHEYVSVGSSPSGSPSGLSATAISSTQIDLVWTDNSNNENEFIIERKTPGESFRTLATVSANQTSYSDNNLIAAETYTYRLSAHNGGGNSNYSNESSATSDQGQSTFKVQAAQDAYIRGGSYGNDTYGISNPEQLIIKKGNNADFFRRTVIKFALGDYSNITSAKLYVYGAADEPVSIRAYELSSDNWDESTLTWNTAPTFDASLGDIDMETTEGWYELDITAFANQEAGGRLSVGLDDPTASSETITLFSKEFELGQYSPYLLIEGDGTSETVLTFDDFESGWGNYTDGGVDALLHNGSYAPSGNSAINLQDNSGIASSFYHTNGIDVTDYELLKVEFSFLPRNFNGSEDFWLRYFNGSSWQTIETYRNNVDFVNGNVYLAEVSIIANAEFDFHNAAKFRFQCDASGNGDDVYIDDVKVTGVEPGSGARLSTSSHITLLEKRFQLDVPEFEDIELSVFPNPASDMIRINGTFEGQEVQLIRVYGMNGELHYRQKVELKSNGVLDFTHNVHSWSKGMYILMIGEGQDAEKIKFVKQ